MAITLFFATVIGTYIRITYRQRGELYFPSNVDSLTVPGDLDCATRRALDKPRLFHDTVRSCMQPEDDDSGESHALRKGVGQCCAVACDAVFSCCCFPCGWCIGNCCRYKAEIAP